MTYVWTREEIAIIGKNPHVASISEKGGMRLDKEFMDRLYEVWSVHKTPQTIQSFFKTCGFPCEIMSQEFFCSISARLRKIDAKKARQGLSPNSSACNSGDIRSASLSQYADHHFVVKGSNGRYGLSDEFYNEALSLHQLGFSITQILEVYEIDASVVSPGLLKGISRKLAGWKNTEAASALTAEQRCRYAGNRIKLLEEETARLFAGIRAKIPAMTRAELREACRFVDALPADAAQGYGKKELIAMCGLSKTRFYRILSDESYVMTEELRNSRDDEDVKKIRQVLDRYPFPMGIRQIFMQLPRVTGVSFSLNKLRRLLKKYGISCQVRRPRNANRARREWLKERVKPNLLRRRFRLHRPGEVVLSDVTYLTYAHGTRRAYGSSAIDPVTGKLLTFCVSKNNDLALGLNTLTKLSEVPGLENALFHSDQGILYLTDEFQNRVREMGMTQSMSKRGNCWDNSPQESFFGHFKDEVAFEHCAEFEDLKKLIESYSEYYNNARCQWTRNRMTPAEYEKYLLGMTDEEFSGYLEKEEEKYRQMLKASAAKAKLRAKALGPE